MIRSSLWKDETLTLDLEESHQRLSMNTSPTLNDSTAWNHMRKIQSVMYMIALALRVFFYFRQIWKRDFFIRTSLLCMASYYSMLTCWQFVDSVHLHVLIRMTVKGSNPLLSLRGILSDHLFLGTSGSTENPPLGLTLLMLLYLRCRCVGLYMLYSLSV